ncbi:right-handed parallel beta-helix repeat-containing protein [Sunxiuqinia elliptica]|uniref:Right handed beta helix region n=1 Tax=Sunxiuqinia elliptica TaxID=655355 RepID=A0A1I2GT58_9BACT|nr:right-handed parallel beta-helix repeat-containing protein [Sunxiuqinia elliptica]SFF20815.1 Right handed beta helix region [Sunxiuqinia elliptica]
MRPNKNILSYFLIPLFVVCCHMESTAQVKFFVAPDGNDLKPGTKEAPLATLTGARDAVRAYKQTNALRSSIEIIVRAGHYEMTEPLVLLPEDGGTSQFPIIYKAEEGSKPQFSGGKKLSGFKVNDEGIWEAKIPECLYYNWRFDQLYVNGKRAVLARTPNNGFLKIGGVKQNIWTRGTGRVAEKAEQVLSFDEANFLSLQGITDEEIENVRFRAYHKWDFTLRFIDKIDRDSARIYTSGQGMKPWNPLFKGGRIVFENYAVALDEAGEWYLNKAGMLYYIPRIGETPENTEIIAPVLENIISVVGDAKNNKLVENIRFEGLAFSHCHYRMPRTGSEPNQAAALINAAIMLEGAKNISFTDCEISRTGQHALWFGKGCSYSKVEHCYLNDLGGGGIYLGDFAPQKGDEHTHNIRLHNNIIQTGGQEFPSAVGVWIGHSSDNEVSHNDIGNFYYSGVSVGWIWGYAESNAKRNQITHNNIHHIGWALLSDMAAVYTLGKSEGTVISNNVVHHVHAYSYGGWGLYTDEGSSDIVMENNLVYSTKTGGFHQHYGENNIIRNNIFAFAKLYQLQCTRVEEHRSFNFERNIVVFDKGVVLQGAWKKIDIHMDNNLYWNTTGDHYVFNGESFADWQKSGHDVNSIIADPYFKDADKYNFKLRNKRNVKNIGFKPFDYELVGVYGKAGWIEKAKLPAAVTKAFDQEVDQNMKEK